MRSATRFNITGITFGIIMGSNLGKRVGNSGFMSSRAPRIPPMNRIIAPMRKGMASISFGHIVPMRLAKPLGVISAIIASNTAHCFCTSGWGRGTCSLKSMWQNVLGPQFQ